MSKVQVWLPVPASKGVLIRPPFQKGGANYRMLHDILPDRVRVSYDGDGWFRVARAHAQLAIDGLSEMGFEVHVTQDGYRRIACVEPCWNAKSNTAYKCECSCAGTNHGSGHSLPVVLASGVSIEGEYTRNSWVAPPRMQRR